jgi:D-glycerate 3-kinase
MNFEHRSRSTLTPITILEGWRAGSRPIARDFEQLAVWELTSDLRSRAFGITAENAADIVRTKADLFFSIIDKLHNFPLNSTPFLETLWNLWLPLAMQLAAKQQSFKRPLIQGILGGQGTGKTTLARVLKLILEQLGYSTVSLSLDDLYKTYADRQKLQQVDPRLIWRGPPRTHDLELGIAVLDRLRSSQNDRLTAVENSQSDFSESGKIKNIEIPRFDKSAWKGAGDRAAPEIIASVDIVLFEGWFVGVEPIADRQLNEFLADAPFPIVTESDRQFARDMNAQLHDYVPLWQRLDKLIVLYPQDYRISQVWRNQAEREMMAAGKSGMTQLEINRFVEYFWKALHPELFIPSTINNSRIVDLVVEIESDRAIEKIYRKRREIEP